MYIVDGVDWSGTRCCCPRLRTQMKMPVPSKAATVTTVTAIHVDESSLPSLTTSRLEVTTVGAVVGCGVGDNVGNGDGNAVSDAEGDLVGTLVVGDAVGEAVGDVVGRSVGEAAGATVGEAVGVMDG